jgi:hypothetical protein
MAGLLNTASLMMCPHGGTVSAQTSNSSVKVGGAFAVVATDTFLITGCAFSPGTFHPCVTIQWVQPAARSKVSGNPTLTEESVGLCVAADQAVQGVVQVLSTQPRVEGR